MLCNVLDLERVYPLLSWTDSFIAEYKRIK